MRRYAITEGLGVERALEYVEANLKRGVEMVQLREKHLSEPDLESLVRRAIDLRGMSHTKILVNGPKAWTADGVHLPSGAGFQPGHQIAGVSCHTIDDVEAAQRQGASFVVFGPVFSKTPVGVDALRIACSVPIPVFALGGVTWDNAAECIVAGAAGIAGIRLFRPGVEQSD